jgi:hypothetical protein
LRGDRGGWRNVNLLAALQDSARIVLVLEFVTGGEMFTFLRRARSSLIAARLRQMAR